MHLVAVDLTTGSMAFCVSKEKSIPAVCNIFDSIMHLQKALRSLREKSWKNNLLFVSPSIRRPTIDDYRVDELLENVNDLKIYEKKIADYQEGLKNGWIKGRRRLSFAWDYDRGLPDGETAYESRAEWEQDLKDDLEVLKEEAAWKQKNIKELWQEYLDDRRTNDEDHGTMEKEIEKVRQWGERRRVVLDLEKQTGQENTSALEECMRHTASKSAQRQEQGRER